MRNNLVTSHNRNKSENINPNITPITGFRKRNIRTLTSPSSSIKKSGLNESSSGLIDPFPEFQNEEMNPYIPNFVDSPPPLLTNSNYQYIDEFVNIASSSFTRDEIDHLNRRLTSTNLITTTNKNISLPDRWQCGICNDNLKLPMCSPCGHLFCRQCLVKWLTNSSLCPNCHEMINFDECTSVRSCYDSSHSEKYHLKKKKHIKEDDTSDLPPAKVGHPRVPFGTGSIALICVIIIFYVLLS